MEVSVRIPAPLRTLTGGRGAVMASGETVKAAIDDLVARHPGMGKFLLDGEGLRRFVNLYVGEDNIRSLDGLDTRLEPGDEISIVPAIVGGAR